jgi:hypothetical protein
MAGGVGLSESLGGLLPKGFAVGSATQELDVAREGSDPMAQGGHARAVRKDTSHASKDFFVKIPLVGCCVSLMNAAAAFQGGIYL